MAQTWEYDVIVMERQPGEADMTYRWRCCRHGTCVNHDGLEPFLNAMGERGWHVAAFTNSERFNCTLILQRAIERTVPAGDIRHTDTPSGPLTPEQVVAIVRDATAAGAAPAAETSAALLAEVKALREQVAQQALAAAPLDAARHLQEARREREATAAHAATTAALERLGEALPLSIEQLRDSLTRPAPPPVPAHVVWGPETLAALEETLQRAVTQANLAPATAHLDPEAMRLLERLLQHEVDRAEWDDRDGPPAGPPVAVLDPAALVPLLEAQRAFNDRVEAGLAREVTVKAEATLAEGAEARLWAALAAAQHQTPAAVLGSDSVERLSDIVRRAAEVTREVHLGPVTATLAPEVAEQLRVALAATPAPVVEARAELTTESVTALRAALAEAVAALPVTEVTPVVQATLDEAAVAQLAARTVTLAPESLAGLEAAVSRAVAGALERRERELARASAETLRPQPEVERQETEEVVRRSWWPWQPSRLRLAFGRGA